MLALRIRKPVAVIVVLVLVLTTAAFAKKQDRQGRSITIEKTKIQRTETPKQQAKKPSRTTKVKTTIVKQKSSHPATPIRAKVKKTTITKTVRSPRSSGSTTRTTSKVIKTTPAVNKKIVRKTQKSSRPSMPIRAKAQKTVITKTSRSPRAAVTTTTRTSTKVKKVNAAVDKKVVRNTRQKTIVTPNRTIRTKTTKIITPSRKPSVAIERKKTKIGTKRVKVTTIETTKRASFPKSQILIQPSPKKKPLLEIERKIKQRKYIKKHSAPEKIVKHVNNVSRRKHYWHRQRQLRKIRKRKYPVVVYHDRTTVITRPSRHLYRYRDFRGRSCHRIISPSWRLGIYYNWGPLFSFRYVYPYYHRKYVFVSIGGYWPTTTYLRYYWYGYHPNYWCGYNPVAQEVSNNTYNYYTYNYNTTESAYNYNNADIDENTFADVRERMAQQEQSPPEKTTADEYFEQAVNQFESGNYDQAAEILADAMSLSPEDTVLPFAYAQALFGAERYTDAAEALRQALAMLPLDAQSIFYPRGLYPDEELLFDQIDALAEEAENYNYNGDLQLLLGYHLLGIGEIDVAGQPLAEAATYAQNTDAAQVLLEVLDKIQAESPEE